MSTHLEEFASLPRTSEVKSLLAWFLRAQDLQHRGAYGVHWGLNLPTKMKGDEIRLNVGPRHPLFAEYFEDGWWCFLQTQKSESMDGVVHSFRDRVAFGDGNSADTLLAVGRASTIAEVLRDPVVFRESSALIDLATTARLPRKSLCNDAVAEFILEAPPPMLIDPAEGNIAPGQRRGSGPTREARTLARCEFRGGERRPYCAQP